MIVTLDIFSGRPNPTWTLSEREQKQLFDRVQGRALATAEPTEDRLGYRGLIVRPTEDDSEGLPQEFRIGGFQTGAVTSRTAERPLSLDEDDEVARFLLEVGRETLPDQLQQFVTGELTQRLSTSALPLPPEPLPIPEPVPSPPPTPCQILNTAYNPGFWNNSIFVRYNNNCYNYAMNDRTDTFAQPGKKTGQEYTHEDCANVGAAATRDGCKTTCSGRVKLVALVIWPGVDYHWYRRHSEGFWGHKPGSTAARNTDNSNRVINGTTLTPANCDRGPYTVFCGYRYSPKGMQVA